MNTALCSVSSSLSTTKSNGSKRRLIPQAARRSNSGSNPTFHGCRALRSARSQSTPRGTLSLRFRRSHRRPRFLRPRRQTRHRRRRCASSNPFQSSLHFYPTPTSRRHHAFSRRTKRNPTPARLVSRRRCLTPAGVPAHCSQLSHHSRLKEGTNTAVKPEKTTPHVKSGTSGIWWQ